MSLYKFTYILLLKNDVQLKQKSDKQQQQKKKKQHTAYGHFCPSSIRFPSTKFSSHFGKKTCL